MFDQRDDHVEEAVFLYIPELPANRSLNLFVWFSSSAYAW